MSSFSASDPASSAASANDVTTALTRREAIKRAALILGVAISPSILAGVLQAQTAPRADAVKRAYLSPQQLGTVTAAAERIIPKTDTPGAIDVGVPAFVDLMYGEYMTDEEKRLFAAGLTELEASAMAAHRRAFAQLSPTQQDALLKQMADASQKKEKSFFHQLKELTLIGYFTSEPVGKKVLHYDPIPGRYDGCIPISEVGNVAWTR